MVWYKAHNRNMHFKYACLFIFLIFTTWHFVNSRFRSVGIELRRFSWAYKYIRSTRRAIFTWVCGTMRPHGKFIAVPQEVTITLYSLRSDKSTCQPIKDWQSLAGGFWMRFPSANRHVTSRCNRIELQVLSQSVHLGSRLNYYDHEF